MVKQVMRAINRKFADSGQHGGFILIVKQPMQYTFRMFMDSMTNSEEGLSVPTYSLKNWLRVVIHLTWDIDPGLW